MTTTTMLACEGVAGVELWPPLVTKSHRYRIIHELLKGARGVARNYKCIQCEDPAREWAWQRGEDPNLISSYEPMCRSCHLLYDLTTEWITAIRKSLTGSKRANHTPETKVKLSLALQGNRNGLGKNLGNRNGAKLTVDNVNEIRMKYTTGEYTQGALAEEYGVTQSTVGRALRHESWN